MNPRSQIGVLLVESDNRYKRALAEAIERTEACRQIHIASNVELAAERLKQFDADVALLNMALPDLNRTDSLRRLRAIRPKLVFVLYGIDDYGRGQQGQPFKVADLGALDDMIKLPRDYFPDGIDKISEKLQMAFGHIVTTRSIREAVARKERLSGPSSVPEAAVRKRPDGSGTAGDAVDIVVIAASTGGPMALEAICSGIPAGFRTPILIVQHMPAPFTKELAATLNKICPLEVAEAIDGEVIAPSRIYVAPGGCHLTVEAGEDGRQAIALDASSPSGGLRPSADTTLSSVARAYRGTGVLCIVLTGMGSDGQLGVAEVKRACRAICIVQSERTSVVYGMPRSVVNAGLADRIEDLDSIASCMTRIAGG